VELGAGAQDRSERTAFARYHRKTAFGRRRRGMKAGAGVGTWDRSERTAFARYHRKTAFGRRRRRRPGRRYRLGAQDTALSRLEHGFESRYRYCRCLEGKGQQGWGDPSVGSHRPHRLSVRTALFQGAERGSTPLGVMCARDAHQSLGCGTRGAVAQLVRVPVCHTGGRGFEPRQPRRNARRMIR
jgi:hypothetical protein